MKKAKTYRTVAVLCALAAAGIGGGYLYKAGKTVPVLIAKQEITANTYVTANDFVTEQIPEKAVYPDSIQNVYQIVNHRISIDVLQGDQIRGAMFSSDTSLQSTVNNANPNIVTFYMSYKPGTTTQTVQPNTVIEMIGSGPNGTLIDDKNVYVLNNTGYTPWLQAGNSSTPSSPMLCLQIDRSKYLAMESAITSGNVQVLLIPQKTAQGPEQASVAGNNTTVTMAATSTPQTNPPATPASSPSPTSQKTATPLKGRKHGK